MAYYSNWCKQQQQQQQQSGTLVPASTLLTPAQVTVSSSSDKLIYNVEYKQVVSPTTEQQAKKSLSRALGRRVRESTVSSSSSSSSNVSNFSNTNTFAAANVVAARFQNHSRSHTRRHSRKVSTDSGFGDNAIWDEWIIKYHDKNTNAIDDNQIEEWIWQTI